MIKEIGKFTISQISHLIGKQYARYYRKHYATLCRKHHIETLPKETEQAYKKKWGKLTEKVNLYDFRLFSRYIGTDINIVPEDIVHNVIEQLLNPPVYRGYYIDKNMADKIFPPGSLPSTLLRRINGFFFDSTYRPLSRLTAGLLEKAYEGYNRIIFKPTVGFNSGKGVELFNRKNGVFYNTHGEMLDVTYLEKAGSDFILQEYLQQSDFMAQFNSTSVNTFRVLAYKSVNTNEVVIPNVILRIGKNGSYLDNAHTDGAIIGISSTGKLNNHVLNQYGEKRTQFNHISFDKTVFVIPNYEKIIDFSKKMAENVFPHRCLNLDIMIDHYENPRLIECNYDGMGAWLYQFCNGAAFGSYTDEIIEYCTRNLKKINRIQVTY